MKKKIKKVYLQQKKRYLKKIKGTTQKPRLSIFRSHQHIYAQLIDDSIAHTITFSSTLDAKIALELRSNSIATSTKEASLAVGEDIGKKALEKQVTTIVFDRGNHPYHGRIKSLAEGARKQGLIF